MYSNLVWFRNTAGAVDELGQSDVQALRIIPMCEDCGGHDAGAIFGQDFIGVRIQIVVVDANAWNQVETIRDCDAIFQIQIGFDRGAFSGCRERKRCPGRQH